MLHEASPRPGPRTQRRVFRPALVIGVLASAVLALAPRGVAQVADYERWYIVEMMGQRAGWAMSAQVTEGDRITSRSAMRFEIRRGEASVAIGMEGEFVETLDGEPVAMKLEQRFGAAPVRLEARFTPTAIEVTERSAGGEKRSTLALPDGAWLAPAAAAHYVQQRLAAGADRIEVRTIDATGGLTLADALRPVTITRTDLRHENVAVMGKDTEATRCVSVSSAQPSVKAVEWLDDQGIPIKVESALGGISLAMVAADRADATARFAAPEMMIRTFIRPRGDAGAASRTSRRARYLVAATQGDLPDLPRTGAQTVERLSPSAARLTIDLDAAAGPPAESGPEHVAESPMIASGDDRVRELARRAVAGAGDDSAARAEALRRAVHRHIRSKNLDVGFAGAAEVARSRAGDCTEHAVLLAAMLRAEGIPSRVATGLVYADEFAGERGVFAYHMWTQALLPSRAGARWTDLDATMPDETPMDATHIALAVSPLADNDVQDVFVALASLLGRLAITIEPDPAEPGKP